MVVADSNEDGFTLACDENVLCSLCTVTPSLVKIDIMPSSAVLPTLISECGNSVNVLACLAEVDYV
jgi:hypothetical protein